MYDKVGLMNVEVGSMDELVYAEEIGSMDFYWTMWKLDH